MTGETNFLPLLFGGDINVYSVARAFYEAYGVKATAYGRFGASVCADSAILDYRVEPKIEQAEVLCGKVREFSARHPEETVLAIGCGDSYVQLLAEHREEFPANVIAPYIPGELLNTLINKEKFYEMCDRYGLPHPATVVYRPEMGDDFDLPFEPPYICKPADGVAYWAHPFEGNEKVFLLDSREALVNTLHKVYASGYPASMIIQEFIPGDDSYMRVLTNYSDRNGKVKLMCLGHVLLEEHNPHGIGNHAVIMTEQNEALCEKIRAFLEDLHYTGFSNFDIKYDERTGEYKLFEINCRQGRSNYYVTGDGYNIARLLVEDRVEEKELPFVLAQNKSLFWVVPKQVAFDYIPSRYHEEMKALIRADKAHNPLFCPADTSFRHKLRTIKNHWRNVKLYRQYNEKKN